MEFPRGGRQRGVLKLKVPSRLQVRVEPGSGDAEGQQRGSAGDCGHARRGDAPADCRTRSRSRIAAVRSRSRTSASLEFIGRSGIAEGHGREGRHVDQDGTGRRSDGVAAERRRSTSRAATATSGSTTSPRRAGPVRVNVNGGSLKVRGTQVGYADRQPQRGGRGDDGRARAGGDLQRRRARLADAAARRLHARRARHRRPGHARRFHREHGLQLHQGRRQPRKPGCSGAIKGGGPTISVRATNADFTIRKPDDKPKTDEKPAPEKLEKELKGR